MKFSKAIEIHVSPTKIGSTVYRFVIQNTTDMPVENIKFNFCGILDPNSLFYTDDTHLPYSPLAPQIFELDYLESNCKAEIELQKNGCIRDYSGEFKFKYSGNFRAISEHNHDSIFQDTTTGRDVMVYIYREPQ
jgi:hypothetical protein